MISKRRAGLPGRWDHRLFLSAALLLPNETSGQQIRLKAPTPAITIASTAAGGDSVVFGSVIGAIRLSDGTIVAADPISPAILYFDRRARVTAIAGRRGGGPGEFGRIRWIGQCVADTVFAFEQARVQVFTNRGKYVRTIETGGHLPGQLFCARAGFIVAVGAGNWGEPGAPGVRRVMASGWTFGSDGRLLKDFGEVPITDAAWDGANWQPLPLGRQMFATIDGAEVILGNGESGTLATLSSSGKWQGGPSLGPLDSRDPTEAEIDAGIVALLGLAPNRHAKGVHDIFARLPRPEGMPPYHRLLADAGGRIWAQLSVVGMAPTRLRWVDRSTGRTGDVVIQAALSVQEVGRDYILAIEELPSGEQRIVEYSLIGR